MSPRTIRAVMKLGALAAADQRVAAHPPRPRTASPPSARSSLRLLVISIGRSVFLPVQRRFIGGQAGSPLRESSKDKSPKKLPVRELVQRFSHLAIRRGRF